MSDTDTKNTDAERQAAHELIVWELNKANDAVHNLETYGNYHPDLIKWQTRAKTLTWLLSALAQSQPESIPDGEIDDEGLGLAHYSTVKQLQSQAHCLGAKIITLNIQLRTEQEMHNAWRKRAEQAEAELIAAAPKAKPPEQGQVEAIEGLDEALKYFGRVRYQEIPGDTIEERGKFLMDCETKVVEAARRYSELAGKGGKL